MPTFNVYCYHVDKAAVIAIEAESEQAAWEKAVSDMLTTEGTEQEFLRFPDDDPEGLYFALGKPILAVGGTFNP
jgi:hypothetical protein